MLQYDIIRQLDWFGGLIVASGTPIPFVLMAFDELLKGLQVAIHHFKAQQLSVEGDFITVISWINSLPACKFLSNPSYVKRHQALIGPILLFSIFKLLLMLVEKPIRLLIGLQWWTNRFSVRAMILFQWSFIVFLWLTFILYISKDTSFSLLWPMGPLNTQHKERQKKKEKETAA